MFSNEGSRRLRQLPRVELHGHVVGERLGRPARDRVESVGGDASRTLRHQAGDQASRQHIQRQVHAAEQRHAGGERRRRPRHLRARREQGRVRERDALALRPRQATRDRTRSGARLLELWRGRPRPAARPAPGERQRTPQLRHVPERCGARRSQVHSGERGAQRAAGRRRQRSLCTRLRSPHAQGATVCGARHLGHRHARAEQDALLVRVLPRGHRALLVLQWWRRRRQRSTAGATGASLCARSLAQAGGRVPQAHEDAVRHSLDVQCGRRRAARQPGRRTALLVQCEQQRQHQRQFSTLSGPNVQARCLSRHVRGRWNERRNVSSLFELVFVVVEEVVIIK